MASFAVFRKHSHWPQPFIPGRIVSLLAPASAFHYTDFEAGLTALEAMGLNLNLDGPLYLCGDTPGQANPGSDPQRAGHLREQLLNPQVGMVFCIRGGFGSSRLLPLLDWPRMARSRTFLLGFSDITALHLALYQAGLISLHGPVLTQIPRLDESSLEHLRILLSGLSPWPRTFQGQLIHAPARAVPLTGPLLGGNLSLICHLLGTPWLKPSLFKGAILFLEDVNVPAYRVNRLLTQLEMSGVLAAAAGLALGCFWGPEPPPESERTALNQILRERLSGLGKPVLCQMPWGHGDSNHLLPVGALAALDPQKATLTCGIDYRHERN